MSLRDVLHINTIKTDLETANKELGELKVVLAETGGLELREVRQEIARLEGQKADLQGELEAQRARAEREIAEQRAKAVREVEAQIADLERRKTLLEQEDERLAAALKTKAEREAESLKAKAIKDIETKVYELECKKTMLAADVAELDRKVTAKRAELVLVDEEVLLQSFGLYKPRYALENSDAYRARLEVVRAKQAALVKAGRAATCPQSWTVNNSKAEGERMIRDYSKLVVRSFNNECDAAIVDVKFSNVESIEKRIRKAFDALNKLTDRMSIQLSPDYLGLKLEELYLCHEYQVKKQEEKEEQKRLREQLREEARVAREIEEAKEKLAKEQKHFAQALAALDARLKTAAEMERAALEQERAKVLEKLDGVARDMLDVEKREQNTRAGYVYVISNIGAFGENVYKIGVTRRLEPRERIDELGDSSVPFEFDIHALIFSDDAPKLETALHQAFAKRKLNMVNARREFFNVSLEEIEAVVKTNFSKPVEFARVADAADYRQSLKLRNGDVARGFGALD